MRTSSHPHPRRAALLRSGLAVAGLALLLAAPVEVRMLTAARVLLATLDSPSLPGLALPLTAVEVHAETLRPKYGPEVRSKRYSLARDGDRAPVLVLLHGVHPLGIDEPRVERMARAFAAAGLTVHTPELTPLLTLEVDPGVVHTVAAILAELSARHGGRQLGAFGVSFTGGLLLMAATEPEAQRALSYVVAVGAYHDLRRVVRHFAGEPERGPDGEPSAGGDDPYGARVLVAAYAPALFPEGDVETARAALRLYLAEHYAEARRVAEGLSPAGRRTFAQAIAENRDGLHALMSELARTRAAQLAALSPAGHLDALRVPSLLLHGLHDPILPSAETSWLARELPAAARARTLITPVLRHAEGTRAPSVFERLALVRFVADMLARAHG